MLPIYHYHCDLNSSGKLAFVKDNRNKNEKVNNEECLPIHAENRLRKILMKGEEKRDWKIVHCLGETDENVLISQLV